ncbi:MAG: hypothetical protein Q4G48_08045 [Bacteroidia bacterium]|nr:hypothetical protein [Bacteroidia bacterium]
MFFNWLHRKRRAKGFGIHSPFAFNLVTEVIYEKHAHTAFFDIQKVLSEHGAETDGQKLHHLSYRLVRYFKPERALEIATGKGINTLYISAGYKDVSCECFGSAADNVLLARNLHRTFNKNVKFIDELDAGRRYDAIFLYLNAFSADMEDLFSMSSERAFWVITGINRRNGKQFWRNIVQDERARLTFDMNDMGVVILNKSYHKANYFI